MNLEGIILALIILVVTMYGIFTVLDIESAKIIRKINRQPVEIFYGTVEEDTKK